MSLTKPTQIAVPFAASGSKTAIPARADNVTGRAGYDAGFPAITRTAKAAGGIPPFGTDFNGIFYDAFAAIQYLEAGGAFPYDSTFATAIGGYPIGALVSRADGMGLWKNLVEGNTTNPDNLGAGWDTLDSGITSVTMTSSNVTLTAQQAARDIIVITGVLTSNLNLIFPLFKKQWTVINKCTGSFSITLKTSSGSGILSTSGENMQILCDGVNILRSSATMYQVQTASGLKSFSVSVSSNAMTVSIPAGTLLSFRSPAINDGVAYNVITASTLSLTIPSGATLGSESSRGTVLAAVALYNKGIPALGIVNMVGGVDLSESSLLSTEAINTNSSSASTVYSLSAITSSPYLVVGLIEITESTAGVWESPPTKVTPRGTNLVSNIGGVGFYPPVDVTASRAFNTTYYNTTSRPKKIKVTATQTTANGFIINLTVNGILVENNGFGGSSNPSTRRFSVEWIVQPGGSYLVGWETTLPTISHWIEA